MIGVLIYLGWDISFSQRIDQWRGKSTVAGNRNSGSELRRPLVRPAATPATWMWDANRQGRLDTPIPKTVTTHLGPSPGSSVAGSWMWDPNHRSPLDPPAQKQPSPH